MDKDEKREWKNTRERIRLMAEEMNTLLEAVEAARAVCPHLPLVPEAIRLKHSLLSYDRAVTARKSGPWTEL